MIGLLPGILWDVFVYIIVRINVMNAATIYISHAVTFWVAFGGNNRYIWYV